MSLQQVTVLAEPFVRALPTTEQWDTHKHFLRRLYIVQGMILKDIVAAMRTERNFHATEKMYKSRFSRWGFAKHNNLKNIEKIARCIVQGGHNNTNATFTINGKSVTTQEVVRYFRRRGLKSLKVVVERSMTTAREANGGETPETKRSDSTAALEASPVAPLHMPVSPVVYTNHEVVLKMIDVYYIGCCQTNLWYTCTAGRFRTRRPIFDAATVLDRFVGFWKAGLDFARKGSKRDCKRALLQARQKIPRIILAEHPSTIRVVLEMLLEYARANQYAIAVWMLREILKASPSDHALAIIFRTTLQVRPSEAESMALSALACGADSLAKQCGQYHYAVVRCRVALIASKSAYMDGAQVADEANRLLENFAQLNQFSAEGYLSVAGSLLENLKDLGALQEAEVIIGKMKMYAQNLSPERILRWTVNCADHLSKVQYCQRKYELAEDNCRYVIRVRVANFGPDDAWVLACMSRLSEWLRLWNRYDDALEVEERRAAGLKEPKDAEESIRG